MLNRESQLGSVLTDFIRSVVREEVKKVLEANNMQPPGDSPDNTELPLKKNVQKRPGYPSLFTKFMDQYPPKKRKERAKAYTAWCRLSDDNKLKLVVAARNYVDDNLLRNGGTYIKYPERFISHKTFEDWIEVDEDVKWIKGAMDFFDSEYEKKTGMVNIWSDKLREMAIDEFKRLGRETAADKIWVFFSDKDMKIRDECRQKGYGFFTFKLLSDTLLKQTTTRKPVRCPECGERGSHAPHCPITLEKMKKEAQEKKEIEEGRLMNVSLGDMFKKAREEKGNVDN